jgi:hypothetical protein
MPAAAVKLKEKPGSTRTTPRRTVSTRREAGAATEAEEATEDGDHGKEEVVKDEVVAADPVAVEATTSSAPTRSTASNCVVMYCNYTVLL